jgi:hypothetical protein
MRQSQGLSLADIGKKHEDVRVGEGDDEFVRVYGISAEVCLSLLQRFPEILTKAMAGGGVKFNDIIGAAPQVISAVIAAATGQAGDDEVEQDAANLPIEIQMDILEAAGRLTFRSGFGPFAQRIMSLANIARNSASSGEVPATRSPQA